MVSTRLSRQSILFEILFCVFFFLSLPSTLMAQDASAVSKGKAIFNAKCGSCHTVGGGDLVGPDLAEVTTRRDGRWLDRFIRQPDVMIREKDPIAIELLNKYSGVAMPNIGIGESESISLIAYFEANGGKKARASSGTEQASPTGGRANAAQPAITAASTPAGNASSGASLFNGIKPLQNRGAQCIACHTLSAIAPPGGGSLGPDLTRAFQKFGGTKGMITILAVIPFPTMAPVYRDHPLTPQEQADIAAYLGDSTGSPANMTIFIACLGIWVMAGLYVILHAVWARRLGGVRASLHAR